MKTICKIKFGSHLYGTDTPESDTDYKGIYMPALKELITYKEIMKKLNECVDKRFLMNQAYKGRGSAVDIDEPFESFRREFDG